MLHKIPEVTDRLLQNARKDKRRLTNLFITKVDAARRAQRR